MSKLRKGDYQIVKKIVIFMLIFMILALPSLAATKHKSKHKLKHKTRHTTRHTTAKRTKEREHAIGGYATWYGGSFHGRRTANDEVYNMYKYTAAHRTLPFGTKIKITNPENNKSVIVRVNDRGPYQMKYFIDLSYKAFSEVKGNNSGEVYVKAEIINDEGISEGSLSTDGAIIIPEEMKSITPAAIEVTSDAPIIVTSQSAITMNK